MGWNQGDKTQYGAMRWKIKKKAIMPLAYARGTIQTSFDVKSSSLLAPAAEALTLASESSAPAARSRLRYETE